MFSVREGLDRLDREALVALAEVRGVRGARSNDDRRSTLARSYRGDATTFVGDLRRADLINILANSWAFGGVEYRADKIFHEPTSELRKVALELFTSEGVPKRFVVDDGTPWNPFLDFTWEEPGEAGASATSNVAPEEPGRPSWIDDAGEDDAEPTPVVDQILPSWLVRLEVPTTSRDPLGLQASAGANADAILPGLNVFTSRARYYSFLAWCIQQAQLSDDVEQHLPRAHRLERLLVLCEAVRHREDPDQCSYVGRRRGKAYVREQTDGRGWMLPTRVLKNQTSNGALRLYRTSLADLGLIEEDDLGEGLGLRLTDRGVALATRFGEKLDDRVVRWALEESEQRKRTETLEEIAETMCLSTPKLRAVERRLLVDALFGKSVEDASPNALTRRETVRLLFRLGEIPDLTAREDVAAEDADEVTADGGVGAAAAETSGNWGVIRAVLSEPIGNELLTMQRAAAYELFALSLNLMAGAMVDAVATAGRVTIPSWLDTVAQTAGAAFASAVANRWADRPALEVAATVVQGIGDWKEGATLGLELFIATLSDRALSDLVVDVVARDPVLSAIVEVRTSFSTVPARRVLEDLVPMLANRHREESSRKGKGEWFALEGSDLVRGEPRPTRAWFHSLRFVQVQQIAADLALRAEEVSDEA